MSEEEKIKNIYSLGIPVKNIAIMVGTEEENIYKILKISPLPLIKDIFEGEPRWRLQGRERARFLARSRDKFTCQDCNKKWEKGQRHFDVHHLNGLCGKKSIGYDSSEDISGLITLCHKCHYNRPEHKVKQKDWSPSGRKPLSTISSRKSLYKPKKGI